MDNRSVTGNTDPGSPVPAYRAVRRTVLKGVDQSVERKKDSTDLVIGDLEPRPFLELPRWLHRQWSGHLAVWALIVLTAATFVIGVAGALLDQRRLIDLATSFFNPELASLSATAVALYVGDRVLRRRGRK